MMVDGCCMGAMTLNMEDRTLHWIKAKSMVLATGGYERTYFSCTSVHTCTRDGNVSSFYTLLVCDVC